MVQIQDIVVGFKFTMCGVPCTVKKTDEKSLYALYTEDTGTGSATIDKAVLVNILNRRK